MDASDQDLKGKICKKLGAGFPFPIIDFYLYSPDLYSPIFFKVPPCPLAFRPIFILDRVFFFPYTLPIKKQLLIN